MPASPDELFAFLDGLGIPHPTVNHPPLFTVEQSQALRGTIPGGHTKNLFLKDKKGALFLVTALEDAAIELKSLHRTLGANGRFSFGPAELMRETLGVEPGSVTPLGAINDTQGPGDGGARRGPDGARHHQLPSAGQPDDHVAQAHDLLTFLQGDRPPADASSRSPSPARAPDSRCNPAAGSPFKCLQDRHLPARDPTGCQGLKAKA